MKLIRIILIVSFIINLTSCATGYKMVEPESIGYLSSNEVDDVKLEYKYNVLKKKYAKKEEKKNVKVIAVKITNNSDRNLTFGKDISLVYGNGSQVFIMENERVFKTLKQKTPFYLLYLLLTPLNFYHTETHSDGTEETNSFPAGLIIGPGLAGTNMIVAGSANKKFKQEILNYDINGMVLRKGEVKYGIIGVQNENFEEIKLKVQ